MQMTATEKNIHYEKINACLYQLPGSKMRTAFHYGNYKRTAL